MSKHLIIQPLQGIGDMIWHLPFIHKIAETVDAPVDLLTIKRTLADQLFSGDPAISRILWLDESLQGRGRLEGLRHLAGRLRDGHYQQVWVLHRDYRWALAAWLAGIPVRRGYGLGLQRLFLNRGPYLAQERHSHPIDLGIAFLRRNALITEEIFPQIVPAPPARAEISARWGHLPRPWIALGLGATDLRRQWGTERFLDLAGALGERYGGTLFLVGGTGEADMASALCASLPEAIAVIQQPLPQVTALLADCNLFAGNDSGMLHLAAATGTPAIGLFGVRYKKIDTHRPADPRRNIHAVFPAEDAGAVGVSMMQDISVAAVLGRCAPWLMPGKGTAHG